MNGGVGDADGTHQSELRLHEKVLQGVFGDGRQWLARPKRAAAMTHGVKLKVAEGNALHFAIGGVIVDPVLVAAEPVACVQHRRVLVGGSGELVQPATGELAEAIEVRVEPPKIIRLKVDLQQIAQPAIGRIEVLSRAIRCDMTGAAIEIRRLGLGR